MAPRRTPAKGVGVPKTIRSHRIEEGLLPMSLILAPKSSKELVKVIGVYHGTALACERPDGTLWHDTYCG